MFSRISNLLILLILSSCTSLGASIANVPTYFGDMERHTDIAYGQQPWQRLDIYTSRSSSAGKRPVVIFFYGGRWSSGDKAQYRFVAAPLVAAGYTVVIPDYQKYPQAKFPAFMHDAARAVAWVQQHGEASRIYVLGHSAGAHIGALLISDARYLKAEGSSPKAITAFAGLAGPYAFTPDEPDLKDIFAPPENYPQMQVPTFIDGNEPPMLLLYGSEDSSVKPYNMTRLADAIHGHHGKVETKTYPGVSHIGIIASFVTLGHAKNTVVEDCIAFFRKYN